MIVVDPVGGESAVQIALEQIEAGFFRPHARITAETGHMPLSENGRAVACVLHVVDERVMVVCDVLEVVEHVGPRRIQPRQNRRASR